MYLVGGFFALPFVMFVQRRVWNNNYYKRPVMQAIQFAVLVAPFGLMLRGCVGIYSGVTGAEDPVADEAAQDSVDDSSRGPLAVDGGSNSQHSLCGSEAAELTVLPPNWSSWSCRRPSEAAGVWSRCLERREYASATGRGCPGAELCCPPEDGPADAQPWWCMCAMERQEAGDTAQVTICRLRENECEGLEARARRRDDSLRGLVQDCRLVGEAAHPQVLVGAGANWEPSSRPGAYWVPGRCLLNGE